MKILYIITGLGLGGAEKVVADLADQMTERGHEVTIAYLKGPVLVKPKSDKVRLHYLGLESIKSFFFASKKYKKLIKEFKPDVVHAHMVHANIFARLNRIGCKIPKLICTAHSSNEGGKLRMLAYRLTNFLSNYNTNVSNEARDALIKKKAFTHKNLHTVYNGINLDRFYKQKCSLFDKSKINFLSIGRFNDQKDYPNLLSAIHIAINSYNIRNIHFYIAGDGELRDQIQNIISTLKLEQYITLLGKRNDVQELINSSDYFILSSKNEGLPTVLLEAAACGLFIISTDCGGSKEIIQDNGILVPIQDSTALAAAIFKATNMSEQEKTLNNEQAMNYVRENFDLHQVIENWEKIYAKQ